MNAKFWASGLRPARTPGTSKTMAIQFIKSRRVIFPDETIRSATLKIAAGKISEILSYDTAVSGVGIDAGDSVLMPGLVDTHVHINEPGRTEWEGFQTATQAAARGGITTVVDMPLNSIPATTTLSALKTKETSAKENCAIDYGFWGGVVPGNAGELASMIDEGALGFKAFLIDSGVEEFPMSTEADLRIAMPILAKRNVPLLVHAELEGHTHAHADTDARSYRTFLESRPREWEVNAIRMMIRLSKETGCPVHIVHLSAADAIADIRKARAEGVKITSETCPHYLFFAAEEIPEGATQFKCTPPIREKENRERLWKGLKDGSIDFVVSDHSPCTPKLKKLEQGNFDEAWGGISGLQFGLSVVWSGMKSRGFEISELYKLMSKKPAEFLGVRHGIAPGNAANLTVWNPDRSFKLEEKMIRHKHSLTPYSGQTFYGVVEKTILHGEIAYDETNPAPAPRIGHQVFRGATT
jgi:allantoinase